jgi:cellulose synthase (UDP-forming)
VGATLLALICSVEFTVIGQTAFAVLLLGTALYLRRHAGTMVSFVLLALSFIATARYLTWRLTTMLGASIDQLSFSISFALWIAEILVAAVMGLGLVLSVWPLHRASQAMATPREQWPTVDLFVLCGQQSPDLLEAMFRAALVLKWPPEKIQVYFVDLEDRPALRERARELGAIYFGSAGSDRTRAFEDAIHHSQSTLIAIVDGATRLPTTFLLDVIGWFVRDPRLAMVHSPHHFLAPPPLPRLLQVLPSRGALFSCAVVRRSSCLELMAETPDLQRAGLLGTQLLRRGNGVGSLGQDPQGRWVRVDQADSDVALKARRAIAAVYQVLRPYLRVATWIALATPLACLLFGADALQGTPALFAAHALPHWLHLYIAWSRGQGSRRRTVRQELRDTLVAMQLLVLTFVTVVRTSLSRRELLRLPPAPQAPDAPAHWSRETFLPVWVVLSLLVILVGLVRLPVEEPLYRMFAVGYIAWAAYNLLTVVAAAAVAQEAGQIRLYRRHQSRQSVMIRLPQGRTLACQTQNFPSRTLELAMQGNWEFEQGSTLQLFVLHEGREQGFRAQVVGQRGEALRVSVTPDSVQEYTEIAAWIKARQTAGWPDWLPGRDADRLAPLWMHRIAAALGDMVPRPLRIFWRR